MLLNYNVPKYQLANELNRKIIRKFKRRKVYSSFRDNIWGVDLADMSKYNRGIRYLLCAIDLFSKYTWFVFLTKSLPATGRTSRQLGNTSTFW